MQQFLTEVCSWCDEVAVLKTPTDNWGCFDAACPNHVQVMAQEENPLDFITTLHGRRTLDMSQLVQWGVADVQPRWKKNGTLESPLEARLRTNRECAERHTEEYGFNQ